MLIGAVLIVMGTAPRAGAASEVGLADQNIATLDDLRVGALGLRRLRYVVAWNAVWKDPAAVDAFLVPAHDRGFAVLVAFGGQRADGCPHEGCAAPTPDQLQQAVHDFHSRYPWVTELTPWNEPNHPGAPSYKDPSLAADYLRATEHGCPSCKVIGGDVVDTANLTEWMQGYVSALGDAPRTWSLHNYGDVNALSRAHTDAFMAAVKGDVWITETNGIVSYLQSSGSPATLPDEARAADALDFGLRTFAAPGGRIARFYVYNWRAAPQAGFDSGLLRADGSLRPAFGVLADYQFGRQPDAAGGSGAGNGGAGAGDTGAAGTGGGGTGSTRPAGGRLRIGADARLRGHGVLIRLGCFGSRTVCRGTVRLSTQSGRTDHFGSARGLTLAQRTVRLRSGRAASVRVALSPLGRRWIGRHRPSVLIGRARTTEFSVNTLVRLHR